MPLILKRLYLSTKHSPGLVLEDGLLNLIRKEGLDLSQEHFIVVHDTISIGRCSSHRISAGRSIAHAPKWVDWWSWMLILF